MASLTYHPQQRVVVTTINKQATIVSTLRPNLYKVAIGPLTMICKSGDLRPLTSEEEKRLAQFTPRRGWSYEGTIPSAKELERPLDLHGMLVSEAQECVERRLDEAARAGVDRVQIVHGIGGGALETAVKELLRRIPIVAHFKYAEGNPGVTWVYLK